jgi:hypothetical protein
VADLDRIREQAISEIRGAIDAAAFAQIDEKVAASIDHVVASLHHHWRDTIADARSALGTGHCTITDCEGCRADADCARGILAQAAVPATASGAAWPPEHDPAVGPQSGHTYEPEDFA